MRSAPCMARAVTDTAVHRGRELRHVVSRSLQSCTIALLCTRTPYCHAAQTALLDQDGKTMLSDQPTTKHAQPAVAGHDMSHGCYSNLATAKRMRRHPLWCNGNRISRTMQRPCQRIRYSDVCAKRQLQYNSMVEYFVSGGQIELY